MTQQIRFHTSLQVRDRHLKLAYQVENLGPRELYLTNHAVRVEPGKGQIPDRTVAFVYLLEDRKTVHITKRRPPIPHKLVQPRNHFVTPVRPGETFSEEIKIVLPVEQNDPNEGKPLVIHKEVHEDFNRVTFSLGYIEGSSAMRALAKEYQGEKVFSLAPLLDEKGQPLPLGVVEEKFLYSQEYQTAVPAVLWK